MAIGLRDIRWWALYLVLAVVAFGTRLLLMMRGGGLHGYGAYDDGVYYAAAASFVHGRLPYANFLFIQPPGVVLVAAPFAWIGSITSDSTGFAVARVFFMVIGAISTVLIAAILRRFGFAAAAIGGGAYALSFVAAYGERSVLLEPFGTLGILIALVVVMRPALRGRTRWLIVGGFAIGAAMGFKIWYIVPALVIVAFAGRGWWRMLIGAVCGACAVYLRFFLADPVRTFQEVVLDQLGRGQATVSIGERLHEILGDFAVPRSIAATGFGQTQLTLLLVGVVLACAIVAFTLRDARVLVVLLAADIALLLVSPSFFLHYTALTAPMLALVIGVGLGRAISLVRMPVVEAALVVAVVAVVAIVNSPHILKGAGMRAPTQIEASAQKVSGCVMAIDPTLLVVSDSLERDLTRNCPLWPDVTGYTYGPDSVMLADGQSLPRVDNKRWQDTLVDYLTSGAEVVLSRMRSAGLDPSTKALLTKGPVLYHQTGLYVALTTTHER